MGVGEHNFLKVSVQLFSIVCYISNSDMECSAMESLMDNHY
jgi:hypothetical protein